MNGTIWQIASAVICGWKVTPRNVGIVQPQRKLAELQYILVELVDAICADGIDSRGHNI